MVNGRPIYGASQEDRARYASFVATTNNPHPLTDATGSRRYICLTIPQGQYIDNVGDINYEQLYAQVLHELRELNTPYWFNNDEVARIQQLNQNYMEQKDMAQLVTACFRKPNDNETVKPLNCTQMLTLMQQEYPTLTISRSARVYLGLAMKELGYDVVHYGNVPFYKAVPQKVA
jgi:predicted P-loop ATPase